MRFALRSAVAMILLATFVTGCKRSNHSTPAPATAVGDQKTYPIRGSIVSVDATKGMVMLNSESIPGYMDAMTMAYQLKDPAVAVHLHPADRITATLLVRQAADGDDQILLDQIVIPAQPTQRPEFKPAEAHIPTVGDAVPDFHLTNQSGRTIHLAQFQGRVLLLTFVYTRCPLPDYCIRMSRNFAQIDRALAADPALYARTHLLSISFDPAVDTPAVLQRYGETYIGSASPQTFAHWDFAVPHPTEVAAITHFFDVGLTPTDGGLFTHTLSTAILGKDGRIRAWYPTNQWTTEQVLATIKSAAAD